MTPDPKTLEEAVLDWCDQLGRIVHELNSATRLTLMPEIDFAACESDAPDDANDDPQ